MNGDAIDRYGELMHRLGLIQAELSAMKGELAQHVIDEGAECLGGSATTFAVSTGG